MSFYKITQNTINGRYIVDENLCHILFIEADNEKHSVDIAKKLGCVWGDDNASKINFWSANIEKIDYETYNTNGYPANICFSPQIRQNDILSTFNERYYDFDTIDPPFITMGNFGAIWVKVKFKFKSIEQYAQIETNSFGSHNNKPDIRIFYLDGKIVDISPNTHDNYLNLR